MKVTGSVSGSKVAARTVGLFQLDIVANEIDMLKKPQVML